MTEEIYMDELTLEQMRAIKEVETDVCDLGECCDIQEAIEESMYDSLGG
jgi:hypothetical protein